MLTDADRELIAAAVDGELASDREAAFQALLTANPAAGILFAQLTTDSHRLRNLPRRKAPAGLADAVASRVAVRATPATTRFGRPASRRVRWLPYAVAASLLLAVAGISFWISLQERSDSAVQVARKRLPRTPNPGERHAHSPAVPRETVAELVPAPRPALPTTRDSGLAALPRIVESAPLPRPSGVGEGFGSRPLVGPTPFESIEARLPVLAAVPDLDRKEVLDRIVSELGRDPAFRLDLFAKDVPRAAAHFNAAARASGVTVVVEPSAQARLHKKLPTVLAVYTESLTAKDVAKVLSVLAKRDRADKSGPVFTTAHLVPVQSPEHRDLRELLGVDLVSKRKAGTPKPTGEKDEAAKTAIMLTFQPAVFRVNPVGSKEVRSFLDRRPARKPSAVPLLVVIRPAL